jgi:hypothetical protein
MSFIKLQLVLQMLNVTSPIDRLQITALWSRVSAV